MSFLSYIWLSTLHTFNNIKGEWEQNKIEPLDMLFILMGTGLTLFIFTICWRLLKQLLKYIYNYYSCKRDTIWSKFQIKKTHFQLMIIDSKLRSIISKRRTLTREEKRDADVKYIALKMARTQLLNKLSKLAEYSKKLTHPESPKLKRQVNEINYPLSPINENVDEDMKFFK